MRRKTSELHATSACLGRKQEQPELKASLGYMRLSLKASTINESTTFKVKERVLDGENPRSNPNHQQNGDEKPTSTTDFKYSHDKEIGIV